MTSPNVEVQILKPEDRIIKSWPILTSIVVIVATMAAGIYHVAFWTSFKMDPFVYLPWSDIFKSKCFILVFLAMGMLVTQLVKEARQVAPRTRAEEQILIKRFRRTRRKVLIAGILLVLSTHDLFAILTFFYTAAFFFGAVWLINYIWPSRSWFATRHTYSLTMATILLWCGSFGLGRIESHNIYSNHLYKQVIEAAFSSNPAAAGTLANKKVLGILGSSLFLTDFHNQHIIEVNRNSLVYTRVRTIKNEIGWGEICNWSVLPRFEDPFWSH